MMGILSKVLAEKKIPTPEEYYWADVEGDIGNVDNVLKITQIRVNYHLQVPLERLRMIEMGCITSLLIFNNLV